MRRFLAVERLTARLPFWAAAACVTLVALWYLAFLVRGDGQAFLGYVNAGGYWYALALIAAAAVFAWARSWPAAAAAVALSLLILSHGHAPALGGPRAAADAPRFRLVTASLRNLNDAMETAAERLLRTEADVLVVQEADVDPLAAALTRMSGGRWQRAVARHEAILCRCPIVASGVTNHVLWADAVLGGRKLRIWNVRAPKAYGDTAANRRFFFALAEQIRAAGPGIAAGDFNATPWNDGYDIISEHARDAWRVAGLGPGFTFPTASRRMGWLIPFIRIDHVFTTGPLVPTRMRVGEAIPGADHFPVIVDLSWSKG